jgi:hypothetical protein
MSGRMRVFAWFALLASGVSAASGQVTFDSTGQLLVEDGNLRLSFRSAALVSMVNKQTGQEYLISPGPNWIALSRFDLAGAPTSLTPAAWRPAGQGSSRPSASLDFRGELGKMTLTVGVDRDSDEIFLQVTCDAASPGLQSVQWGFFGLDLNAGKLVIPGQAGTYFSGDSSPNFVGLDYPTHWESQFAVYEHRKGSVLVYAHEQAPNFKRLHASRQNGNLDFGFEIFAVAPWSDAVSVPAIEWRFKGFAGDWREPTAYYKSWWKSVGPKRPTPLPDWVKDIRAVATIRFLDTGIIDELATRVDPAKTLLYLVDWRKAGFDLNYPDYTPSDSAAAFAAQARRQGFRIMLHTSALGVSQTNPNYDLVKARQLRLPNSLEPLGWLWDLDPGDIRRVAYISPCSPAYRKLYIDSIRPAVEALQPDAIHLDAGGTIQNDGNGLFEGTNTIQGMIQFQSELLAAYPGLAFGYESLTEINAPFISFSQRWSSDSPGHPIGTYLFGDDTLPFGFLDQPAPDEDSYISYLKRYEQQGIMPTAPIRSRSDFDSAYPRLELLLRQFRIWQDNGFAPDWSRTSEAGTFYYKSPDGQTQATLRQGDSEVTLDIGGRELYHRLRGSTSAATDLRIRNWPGYSATGVTGLNPAEEYWLETDAALPDTLPHIEQTPGDVHIGNGSFLGPDFALVNLQVNRPPTYSFSEEFAMATKGTFYRGVGDRGLINGAAAAIMPVLVGNRIRNSALVMQPPYRAVLGGVAYTEFTVKVPNVTGVTFQFDAALADTSNRHLPTVFAVWVNGQEIWRNWIGAGGWSTQSLDLTPWHGQTIKLRLISGPDANQNPMKAFACWSSLSILTLPSLPDREILLRLPSSANVQSTLPVPMRAVDAMGLWAARTPIPTDFVVFTGSPTQAQAGDDLLDLPATRFRRTRDGMPSVYEGSGNAVVRALPASAGNSITGLYIEPPTDGRIYSSWAVRLPAGAAGLSFAYGLLESPPDVAFQPPFYSGASFHVFVNGEEVFSENAYAPGPHAGRVELSRWAGQPVVIQVAVDAEGTAIFDWCYFSSVRLAGSN